MELLVLLVTLENRDNLEALGILDTQARLVEKEERACVVPQVFVGLQVLQRFQEWIKK